ncbi:predicted protein [Nematostella vectensis]|uniref:Tetratricopeptide repeat protein 19, mitochondrial n=1 Tax=Nematostella vectensis TaxID=45351 RepID=A7RRN8_NEMVE|nr:tetratricopeptide repeat protein 19, mitochondrial [Nematostella vectensis]EDO45793.1 predicted protein [Nematostella vectensis]|eukprot:XP_001637856.1 predicted protein [Nematostella vectensis]
MRFLTGQVISNCSRCVGCLFSRAVGIQGPALRNSTRKCFSLLSPRKTFVGRNTSFYRVEITKAWLSQNAVTNVKARIPDELWALLIIGGGGVAVFTFVLYKKKQVADMKSTLKIKLAEAKQLLDSEEKDEAYVLLKDILNMIHLDIAEKRKKNQPPTHKALRFVLDKSANLASELEKWEEAEHLYRLTIQEYLSSGMDTDDDAVIEVSLKMSQACEQQNKLELALEGYKWCAGKAEEKVTGADEASDNSKALLGVCLDGLGTFLLTHGHAEQATEVFEHALEIAEEVLGPSDDQTLVVMNNLAKAYAECGKYELAEGVARKTIALAEKTEHSFLAVFMSNYGNILMERGKIKKAKRALIKALKLAEEAKDEEARSMIQTNMMKLDISF